MTLNRIAQRAVAHPATLIGFGYCLAWFAVERGNIGWGGFATIVGIYLAILIVRGQSPEQAKLDAIVKAFPEASDELIRAEERDEHEIEAMRADGTNAKQ